MAYKGDSTLGSYFSSSRKKGQSGLPTLSVTLQNGLVARADLDRKTDTNLSPEEHLVVRKGDIAYNMMRMWQGASGLALIDGLVSPAYVVLAPKKNIDSCFATYLFKTPRMIYLFWAYSYGLTKDRLRLYFDDFARIPVIVPKKSEQIKIAQILSTWDNAIDTLEKIIVKNQLQKKGLMQQLLTGERRLPTFDGKWEDMPLSSVAQILVSNVDKKSDDNEVEVKLCNYTDVYYNTYITADMPFMEASANEREIAKFTLQKGDVIITKDSETPGDIAIPAYVKEDLGGVICGYHLAIIRPRENQLDGYFLSQILSLPHVRYYFFSLATGATRFGLSIGAIEEAVIRIPEIKEQRKIATIISNADAEIAALKTKLRCLNQEKQALMQQLLSGKKRVKTGVPSHD